MMVEEAWQELRYAVLSARHSMKYSVLCSGVNLVLLAVQLCWVDGGISAALIPSAILLIALAQWRLAVAVHGELAFIEREVLRLPCPPTPDAQEDIWKRG